MKAFRSSGDAAIRISAQPAYALDIPEGGRLLKSTVQLIRVKQWIKNGFVFVPLLFVFAIPSLSQITRCALGALLFCFVSSSVYIMNDIFDVAKDRAHPVKRNRPIASGAVPIPVAYLLFGLLLATSLVGAFFFDKVVAGIILAYFVINIAYTLFLKKLMFIDVFTISLGFILRLCAGFRILHKPVGESCNIWFILFVMFLTLFIGIGKRCSEIKLLGNDSAGFRESLNGCSIAQLEQLIIMLMTCTIMSYAIFVYTSEIKALFTTAPVLMYGIFRYHFLNEKSTIAGSPELIVYKDRPMCACLLLWAVLFVSICIVRSYTV